MRKIVAITGSVGKTGTKEAMRLALSRQGATHASVASYNNHWGVPLTLARMPRETDFGVFEIGMNHAHEILPLTAHGPSACGRDHHHRAGPYRVLPLALGHRRRQGRDLLGLEPGGTAVLNRDSAYFERLRAHALRLAAGRVVTFGEHEAADIRAERIIVKPDHSIVDATSSASP